MLTFFIKSWLYLVELTRSLVLSVVTIVKWFFKNKYTTGLFVFLIVMLLSWVIGFLLYVSSINQTIDDIVKQSPEFGQKTDAIVVLTGGSERIKQALFLLEKGFAEKLFISGVNKEVKLYELLFLHGYNVNEIKILREKIELGYAADDTIENAQEISDWAKKNNIKSITLVTSNYHIKRAMLEIQDKLPDVKIIPRGVVPLNIRIDKWWEFSTTRSLLITEYNKYILANIRVLFG